MNDVWGPLQRAHEAQRKFLHLLGPCDPACGSLDTPRYVCRDSGCQPKQAQLPVESLDKFPDLGAAMHWMTIDYEENQTCHTLPQAFQRLDADVRGHVPIGEATPKIRTALNWNFQHNFHDEQEVAP